MNKILANQIITDCKEFENDTQSGVYENNLDKQIETYKRITNKFHRFLEIDDLTAVQAGMKLSKEEKENEFCDFATEQDCFWSGEKIGLTTEEVAGEPLDSELAARMF